jgi:hypothetical protein
MAGYTRQSSAQILSGEIVSAAPINAEYNQIVNAFDESTGHKHDGTSAEGPPIDRIADADQNNKILIDTGNNHIEFYIDTGASTQQLRIEDGAIVPITDDDIDLGAVGAEFKDLHLDGTANIDSLVADTADINGGTVDGSVIGGTTPAAATMTDLTATGTINFAGATVSNGGTVTTVAINGGTISGITDLAIADGGTAASNASDARDNLGLTIGTNIQAYDAGLQSIAGLTTAADKMIYTTALDTYAVTDLSAAGRALIDDASAGDQRTTLGLGTMATQNANSVAITGGTISGITNISDTGNTLPFSFSTTITDSDPGSGVFRLDNATQNTATNIYIDDEDSNAVDVSAFIQTLSGGNNPSSILGLVTLRKEFSPEVFLQFKVTGVINAAGYTKLAVTNLSSSTANPFSNSDNVLIDISLSGDKGDAGDITGPVSSTDNAIARWDGTAGNLIQDSSVLIADDGTITAAQYDSTESLPDIKPSLNLDFANVKTLDPRITYTRASTGTYYDGKTFAKAEENLLLQSQDFTTSWLLSNATITANSTTAPDGSSTADTLTGNGASGQHLVQQQITVISGLNYVFSFFAKANTNDFVQLRFGGGFGSPTANFDLSAGTVGTTTGTITATIQDAGSGWYRCSGITDATITGLTAVQMYLVTSASAAAAETNTLSTSIYLWGAQLEQRDSLTDYTPTTTQPITNYIPALQTAASGVARFDHDPITSESLGFLIEEQRTNLMTYSQELDNGAWSVNSNATILANAVVAPDGTVTADLLRENGINGEHYHGQSLTYATGTDYTISAYVRPAGRHQCQLFFPASAFSSQVTTIFDLSAGTVGTSNADNAGIETLPGGWFRIWQTHRATASTSGNTFLRLINAGSTSYQGDGYSGVYIWGAQLEAGAFPTSYIKTTGAQATRNADAASMTGTNFSEWYRQDAGTIFEISRAGSPTGNAFAVQMSDNSYSNRVIIGQDSANAVGQVLVSSSVTLSVTASGRTTDALALVFAATTNDGQIAKDGALGSSDTSGAMPTALTRLDVGADHTGANGLNGTISRLTYYPKRLSNATLQALTEE